MSITDQLDTQLRATNVVKLDMRKGSVGTTPALKLLLGVEAIPLDFRHNRTELDALHILEDYRMMQKRKIKNISSSNRERKLRSCVMVLARVMKIRIVCLLRPEKWVRIKLKSFVIQAAMALLSGESW